MRIRKQSLWQLVSIVLALVTLGAAPLLADGKPTDQEIRDLIAKSKDYRVKFQVIKIGQPAMIPLFDRLAELEKQEKKDDVAIFETRSMLRWVAMRAAEGMAPRPPVVATLTEVIKSDRPVEQRSFAATLLGQAGGDEAVQTLAPLLADDKLRDAALAALIEIPGMSATQAMAHAEPQATAEFKCALLTALGNRRDPAVTPVLQTAAKDGDENARIAAIKAMGASGDPAAAPTVLEAAATGSDNLKKAAVVAYAKLAAACLSKGQTKEAEAMYAKVLELEGDDASRAMALHGLGLTADVASIPKLTDAAEKGSPAVKSAAMDALLDLADDLLDKGDKAQAASLYDRVLQSADRESARIRAIAGLGRLGDSASARKILPFLNAQEHRIQGAAVAALKGIEGAEITKALSARLKDESPLLRLTVLAALKERKDASAAPDILPLVGDANEEISLAAIAALGSIADPAAVPALLKATESESYAVKTAAYEAYAEIGDAELARGKTAEALAIYHKIIEAGAKKRARDLALAGLGRIADPASLLLIEPMVEKLKKEDLDQALDAYVAIGDKLAAQGKRDEAVKIYSKALSKNPPSAADLKQKLRTLGEKMEFHSADGKIRRWWVIGPFPAPDIPSWEKPLFPETEIDLTKEYDVGGRKYRWTPIETDDKEARVNVEKVLGANDKVVAYAYAEIVSKDEQDVRLRSGSDDGLLVWLNGERVHAFLQPRSGAVDEDNVKVHLKKGPNPLLLKVCEIGGGWSYCLRITNDQGANLSCGVR
ncbi:MAG: HEAT repeat domain-containing protein [Planctomycetota bacterium]